jgi:hypothetical protein
MTLNKSKYYCSSRLALCLVSIVLWDVLWTATPFLLCGRRPRRRNQTSCALFDSASFPGRQSSPEPEQEQEQERNRYYDDSDSSTSASTSCSRSMSERPLWHVWRTADRLSETMPDHPLTPKISLILRQWGQRWQGISGMEGLLNKSNLLSEVEESMAALGFLLEWMDQQQQQQQQPQPRDDHHEEQLLVPPITLVDVCCGKGVCSMLASYLFQDDPRISKIIMMDKNDELDWSHIEVANQRADTEHRPIIETRQCNLFEMDDMIEWFSSSSATTTASSSSTTTTDTTTISETPPRIAMIGIHLCRNLSPTFVGIANALGPSRVPFLCLAPCCLPRVALKGRKKQDQQQQLQQGSLPPLLLLEVAQYESPLRRQARLAAAQRRRQAKQRRTPCILCRSTDHKVFDCPQLLSSSSSSVTAIITEAERQEIFARAAALEPCWKCGQVGHLKQDCPASDQASSLPALIPRPVTHVDVSHVLQNTSSNRNSTSSSTSSSNPFAVYCHVLSTAIEKRESVQLLETGLQRTESSLREHGNNWNRERKTIYIVATDQRKKV